MNKDHFFALNICWLSKFYEILVQVKLLIFLLEHASFTHSLVSRGLPLQVFPEVHLLVRLSVPLPHVTEHDQESQNDQTTKGWVHEQPRIKHYS